MRFTKEQVQRAREKGARTASLAFMVIGFFIGLLGGTGVGIYLATHFINP